jgi:hypothetical protein
VKTYFRSLIFTEHTSPLTLRRPLACVSSLLSVTYRIGGNWTELATPSLTPADGLASATTPIHTPSSVAVALKGRGNPYPPPSPTPNHKHRVFTCTSRSSTTKKRYKTGTRWLTALDVPKSLPTSGLVTAELTWFHTSVPKSELRTAYFTSNTADTRTFDKRPPPTATPSTDSPPLLARRYFSEEEDEDANDDDDDSFTLLIVYSTVSVVLAETLTETETERFTLTETLTYVASTNSSITTT